MDIIDIGAAIALTGGAATAAQQAAAEANEKAGLADAAAQAANTAAAGYGTLAEEAETDRAAMNWWNMDTQALLRDALGRIALLEAQMAALTNGT